MISMAQGKVSLTVLLALTREGEGGLNNGNEYRKSVESLTVDKADGYLLSYSKRRSKFPEPVEKEKGFSLWSMIKDTVGKDVTRVLMSLYLHFRSAFKSWSTLICSMVHMMVL